MFVLAGVAVPAGAGMARYLRDRLPGVVVPDAVVGRLEEAGAEAPDEGVRLTVEIVDRLRAIAGVAGVHVMGLGRTEPVRRVVAAAGLDLHGTPAGLHRPLGEELLEPTRIYARDCLALVGELGVGAVHAYAHITGGGLAGNTARVVPQGLQAVLDRSTWQLPPVVRLLEEHGVPRAESERAFNCGVGMVAAVSVDAAEAAVALLRGRGIPAWVAGRVDPVGDAGAAPARLVGSYR
jgi:phosphoribosylaminoimidazole (AIR) synthetase